MSDLACAKCGHPRREHSYNGACYGLCAEFVAPPEPTEGLLPCPFCGSEPSVSRRQDEDLATHNIVEWICISCLECGSSHCEWPVTVEPGPIERWNKRALSPPEPTEGPIRQHLTQTMLTYLDHMVRVRPAGQDRDAAEWAIGELERRAKLWHQAFRLAVHHQDRADAAESALRAMPLQEGSKK